MGHVLNHALSLKRDYNQNGTHHSGMWGSYEGLNPEEKKSPHKKNGEKNPIFGSQNDDVVILWSKNGVGACAASFLEQRL